MVCKSCCPEQKKFKKGLWSPEEDRILKSYVLKYGHGCWSDVPKLTGLERCGKSCRLRWINYLRPGVKIGDFSPLEEMMVINAHEIFGNRWSRIASMLPGRTDNEVKNFWKSHLKKKLRMLGKNPNVHGPPGEFSREEILKHTSTESTSTQTNFTSEGRLNLESSTSETPVELRMAPYDNRSSMKSEIGFTDVKSNSISECPPRESDFLSVMFSEWWNAPQDEKSKSNVDSHTVQTPSQSIIDLENSSSESFQPRFHSVSQYLADTEIEHIISSEFPPEVFTANFSSDVPSEIMSWDLPSQLSLEFDGSILSNDFSTPGNTNAIGIAEQGANIGTMDISNDVNLRIDDDTKLFENCASLYWEFC